MPNGHFQVFRVDVTPRRKWPNAGLYRDLDIDQYHDLEDRASASILRTIHNRTPAHARAFMKGEVDPMNEANLDKRMREAILQPSRFQKKYAVDTRCPTTTSDGTRCEHLGRIPYRTQEGELEWFCDLPSHHPEDAGTDPLQYECTSCDAEPGEACTTLSGNQTDPHPERRAKAQAWPTATRSGNLPSSSQADVQTISEDKGEQIDAMREVLHEHPSANNLLFEAPGLNEATIVFTHEKTGVPCKARIDRLTGHNGFAMAVEYMTVSDAQPGPQKFGQLIERQRYDIQGQFYRMACISQGIRLRKFAIVAQEREPPYAVSVHLFRYDAYDDDRTVADLESAENDVLNALREFKQCTVDKEWPAYPDSLLLARVPSDADAGGRE